MKLRINLDANADEDKSDSQEAATGGDTKSNDELLLDSDDEALSTKKKSWNASKTPANVAPIFLNCGAKQKADKVVADDARAKFLHSDLPELLKKKTKQTYSC